MSAEASGSVPVNVRSLRATPAQRRLMLAAQLRPSDPSANYALLCKCAEGTDPHRLARAICRAFQEHESFNEVFRADADGQVFAELSWGRCECPVASYTTFAQLQSAVRARADTPVDVGVWPLFQVEVATVGEDVYFAFTGSHLTCDAFGFYQLVEDFDRKYENIDAPLPYTKSPSSACAPSEAPQDELREYFEDLFAGVDSLAIGGWERRDASGRIAGVVQRYATAAHQYQQAGQIAAQLAVRRFSVLLAAYGLMVACLSRQRVVAIATPLSNRRSGESAATRGLMMNTLPVRVDLESCATFAELCADVDRQVESLLKYESCSVADVARGVFKGADVNATMPSANFTLYPRPLAPVFNGAKAVPVQVGREYIQYPLGLAIEVDGDEVTLIVERARCVPDIDFADMYWAIVEQASRQTDVPLDLLGWTRSAACASRYPARRSFTPPRTVTEEFSAAVARSREAVAVECGSRSITYAELDAASDAVAAQIAAAAPGPHMGLCMRPSIELITMMLGILKAGLAYLPLPPDLPAARVESIVRTCDGLVVAGNLPSPWLEIPGLRSWAGDPGRLGAPRPAGPQDAAYVMFTSGTTGRPKGVPVSHEATTSSLKSLAEAMPMRDSRWCLYHSYAFDISVWEIFGSLLFGGVLCIPEVEERADPDRMAAFVSRSGVQILGQTPSAFELLGPRLAAGTRHDLRSVVFCGERLDFHILRDFARAHPQVRLINLYGITETTIHSTFYQLPRDQRVWPEASVIGVPLADTSLAVVDGERRVVPRGCAGEIAIGGVSVMRGYLGQEALTRERVVAVEGQRMYLTGDLAMVGPGGELVYLDRIDSQVQVRGHRVELGEIERTLLDSGEVAGVCATANGEGVARELAAFVVLAPGGDVHRAREHIRSRLPSYMVPGRIVAVEALPLNANGKTDRIAVAALLEAEAERRSENGSESRDQDLVAEVMRLWADVLDHDEFTPASRFFDVGGTSASLLRVSREIRSRFGVDELDVIDLFEHCTPAATAALLHERHRVTRVAAQ
ncbi:amino acid adenylation domain protein [Segniliparus rotundus DSM 44985]|uniref:Amino acid adenylation domain protein n=1 Tax=Segniliparus rotundus (strain ATCC BAA-972 / CDC 1076 / CIP 108378 / DSM 44985 / JCM 13578) TaxID=640132 RepID=D6Z780_SEGRD|nr:amino acid adenylation domain-containing protein [Segniliparus rotundus]ADG97810.1 amino acid adenylation domain protein [Segniliparus rotundus DSM 44985]